MRKLFCLAFLLSLSSCFSVSGLRADPTALYPTDFEYVGAFKVPRDPANFSNGGNNLAFDPQGNGGQGSLWISGRNVSTTVVCEISIPTPVISATYNLNALNVATTLTPFFDPSGGLPVTDAHIYKPEMGGMVWYDSNDGNGLELYWDYYGTYNVSATNYRGFGVLAGRTAKGMWGLGTWNNNETAGPMFTADPAFANEYLSGNGLIAGYKAVSGQASSSWGPAMFSFNANQNLPDGTTIQTTPLVYYTSTHTFDMAMTNVHPAFMYNDMWGGGAWLKAGCKQAVIQVGRKAIGGEWYGQSLPGACDISKGYHGDPYIPEILFYNVNDLIAVATGRQQPYLVQPYASWNLMGVTWPGGCQNLLNGAAYDSANNLLYVLQYQGDIEGYNNYPLIQVFKIVPSCLIYQPFQLAVAPVQNQTARVGTPATFSIQGQDVRPVYFQWEIWTSAGASNGQPHWAPIQGATQGNYTIATTSTTDNAAQFMCVVYDEAGYVHTNAATLTVTQ